MTYKSGMAREEHVERHRTKRETMLVRVLVTDLFCRSCLVHHVVCNSEGARGGPTHEVFDALHGVHLVSGHRREGTA